VRVSPDAHQPVLRRAWIAGRSRVRFAAPVIVVRRGRGRRVIRPLDAHALRNGLVLDALQLGEGERVQVRP
jgi:hypothetical protein